MSTPDAAPTSRRPRRAPGPDERQRDATQSRQRILAAALAEFADKGYAGARVREIARRAGVNTQLISYYFGGKDGLYKELVAAWYQQEAGMAHEQHSFADQVAGYLRAFAAHPERLRMFVWEGLTRRGPRPPETPPDTGEAPEVTQLRRQQAAGEIADDIDPAYLLVAVMGAVTTIVTMPAMIERLCGVPADSEEFFNTFEKQLRLIISHLADTRAT